MSDPDLKRIAEAIRTGNRRQLAKSITRAESTREDDRAATNALLDELLNDTGKAIRVGISGTPGVGKSSFIEALGQHLCEQGKRVAVLSVDPSSSINGGSILGDKTRMPGLSANALAFIRPSPSGATLGGVASRTRESILLCEAAGFDVVLVETVGVGQSEVAVSNMTDLFLLLLLPSGGDELQGIKRGVVELADIILINKADGELVNAAQRTVADYRAALQLLRSNPGDEMPVEVHAVSAATNAGVSECWSEVEERWHALQDNGGLEIKRSQQRITWLRDELHDAIQQQVSKYSESKDSLAHLETSVANGKTSPGSAVCQFIGSIRIVERDDQTT